MALAIGVATFLSGLDYAVIATAMPTVIGQLGGLSLYPWVFASYLLTSTVVVPIYGKLADLYGRKRVFLAATAIFALGSLLCGQAERMEQLILFRAIQGAGAGGVQPITMTIIGDVFPLRQRARMMGATSAIWGASALLGPAIGGFLTEQVSWRWVFLVNLPLCLLAMFLIARFLDERIERRRHAVDAVGAVLLTSSVTALLLGLQSGEQTPAIADPRLLLGAAALMLVAFVWWESRFPEPLVPLGLFRSRIIAVGTLNRAVMGVVLFGQTSFVPPFVQGVLGATPTQAGLILGCTSVGWSIASSLSGRALLRWGYRWTGAFGGLLLMVGIGGLRWLGPGDPIMLAVIPQIVIGAGFGTLSPVTLLSMQTSVAWGQRGVVTSLSQFAMTIGGTLGVSLAGAVFVASLGASVAGADPNDLLSPERRAALFSTELALLTASFADALRPIYTLLLAAAVVVTLEILLLPGGRAEQHVAPSEDLSSLETELAEPSTASPRTSSGASRPHEIR